VREAQRLHMTEARAEATNAAARDAALDIGERVALHPQVGSHRPPIVPRVESLA